MHSAASTDDRGSKPEKRQARNGEYYTKKEFEDYYWHNCEAKTMWEEASPAGCNDQMCNHPGVPTPATTQIALSDPDASAAGSNDQSCDHTGIPTPATTQDDLTEERKTPSVLPQRGAMQCPICNQVLCGTESLAFFRRVNKANGIEVHLMLKPELADIPPNFHRMTDTEKGAVASWQCACGHKLGDTRNVGPRKASMTAFKSSAVKVFGQHHSGQKSKWPSLYSERPFNAIELRQWSEFQQ